MSKRPEFGDRVRIRGGETEIISVDTCIATGKRLYGVRMPDGTIRWLDEITALDLLVRAA